jgi:WD40 repeat protein
MMPARQLVYYCAGFFAFGLVFCDVGNGPLQGQESKSNTLSRLDLYGDQLPPSAIARLGTTRLLHHSPIDLLVLSPNGQLIASVGGGVTLRIWDRVNGQHIRTIALASHADGLAFSPDSKKLAVLGECMSLWDIDKGAELFRCDYAGHEPCRVFAVAFSPDGKRLAAGSRGDALQIWDTFSGREVLHCTGHSGITYSIAFSPGGQTFASASADGTVRIWETQTGKEVQRFGDKKTSITTVVFDPKADLLAFGDWEGNVGLWDLRKQAVVWRVRACESPIGSLVFSSDTKVLVSGAKETSVTILEVNTGKNWNGGRNLNISGLAAFTPDNKCLVSWGTNKLVFCGDDFFLRASDKRIHFQDSITGQEKQICTGHSDTILGLAVSNDNRTIATAGWDGIRVWDASSGKQLVQIKTPSVSTHIVFAPNGKTLASGDADGMIRIWDSLKGKLINQYKTREDVISGVAFSPDGQTILSSGCFFVEIRESASCKLLSRLGKESETEKAVPERAVAPPVSHLTISPNGKMIACVEMEIGMQGAIRSKLKLWDMRANKKIVTGHDPYQLSTPLAFSCDNRVLIAGVQLSETNERALCLIELSTGKERLRIQLGEVECFSVAFSPDGREMAGGCSDGRVRMWNTLNGKTSEMLAGHSDKITKVAYASNGKWLVSSSADTTSLVWARSPR